MMSSSRNKLTALVAIALAWCAFQPRIVSVQTSRVGNDGFTRVLWRGTDGSVSLYKLDANLNFVAEKAFEPHPGWKPLAITAADNNNTYILWANTDGRASLWKVDGHLNWISAHEFGPFAGFTAQSLSRGGATGFRLPGGTPLEECPSRRWMPL